MEVNSRLKELIELFKTIKFKELERTEDLGRDYNFKEAVTNLKKIHDDLSQIVDFAPLLRIPDEDENKILSIAERANQYIDAIKNFTLKGNEANAPAQHTQIHTNIKNLYQEDLKILPPLLERASILKLQPAEVDKQITKALQDVKKIQKIESEAGEIKGNIENIVKELRNSLGKEGALISSVDFEKQSNEHKFLAKLWFGGFVFSIIFTIVMVIILSSGIIPFLNLLDENNELGHIIQVSLFKIILLSVAYLLIHQSIKNYKINRHLYVLNKHRQLTLSIYPLMLHATNNPEQSNIILGQASKAIFEPGMTGYLEKDDNTNPINLTEVINKIADKK